VKVTGFIYKLTEDQETKEWSKQKFHPLPGSKMQKMFKSTSEEYICGINEDNSISIFKMTKKKLDPCYQINKPQNRPNSACKSKSSQTSRKSSRSMFIKILTPRIIDCVFLNDEYLLYIDEENFAHVHFFGKNSMVSEKNLKGAWSFNLFNKENKGDETESYVESLKIGSNEDDFWGLVVMSQNRTTGTNEDTEFFTSCRSVIRVFQVDIEDENLLVEVDFFDFEKNDDLKKIVLSSIFLKEENEFLTLIGLEENSEKIYQFELDKKNGSLKFLSPREKNEEDSLYLIISGCKSARKFMSADRAIGFSEKTKNIKLASDFDLRVKLNLE